jgi:peptidoglycan/LPS O-acetylase OafA/YrhL
MVISKTNIRNANIERLRFLASAGILWYHLESVPYASVGYAGLPIFLMVFSALIVQRSVEEPFQEFVSKRFSRLILPWLFWSCVYAVLVVVKHAVKSRETGDFPSQYYLIGSYIHLWFLPYAFIMGLLIYVIHRVVWSKVDQRLTVGCLVVISFSVWFIGAHFLTNLLSNYRYTPPFPQWVFGFPGILVGCAIGYSLGLSKRARITAMIAIMASSVIMAILLSNQGIRQTVIPYGIGITCVCLLFMIPGKSDPISHFLASLTYGIYLVHPMVVSVIHFLFADSISIYGVAVLTLIGSMSMVVLIQQTPLRRFV